MSIPNMQWSIEETRGRYPRAWDHCHHEGDPEAHDFIILAARDMSAHNTATNIFGLNAKRGDYSNVSMDVIYAKDTSGTDGVFDVIAGAGGSNPQPGWNYLGPGGNTTSGYIDPFTQQTHYDYSGGGGGTTPTPVPPKPAPPTYPPYESGFGGDTTGQQFTTLLEADYQRAGRPGLDATSGTWAWRTMYDAGDAIVTKGTAPADAMKESAAKHRVEWCAELGIPVTP